MEFFVFEMSDLKLIAPVGQLAPEAMAAFKPLDQSALADGAIPKKYKELTAIAVARTTPTFMQESAHVQNP
jgi:alkylhydroperoxidase/carboxymuconolactone decarboxylase family protein YurZ